MKFPEPFVCSSIACFKSGSAFAVSPTAVYRLARLLMNVARAPVIFGQDAVSDFHSVPQQWLRFGVVAHFLVKLAEIGHARGGLAIALSIPLEVNLECLAIQWRGLLVLAHRRVKPRHVVERNGGVRIVLASALPKNRDRFEVERLGLGKLVYVLI